MSEWQPMSTAPKHETLLLCTKNGHIYCGKERYGLLGEPFQDEFAWRCSSSGRYATPKYWMSLPKLPIEKP